MAIGVTAKMIVQEGKNAEFEEIFSRLADAVNNNEDGCDFYHFYKMRGEENAYMVLEQYKNKDAVAAHQKTEHFQTIGAELANVIAAPPEIKLMDSI